MRRAWIGAAVACVTLFGVAVAQVPDLEEPAKQYTLVALVEETKKMVGFCECFMWLFIIMCFAQFCYWGIMVARK